MFLNTKRHCEHDYREKNKVVKRANQAKAAEHVPVCRQITNVDRTCVHRRPLNSSECDCNYTGSAKVHQSGLSSCS